MGRDEAGQVLWRSHRLLPPVGLVIAGLVQIPFWAAAAVVFFAASPWLGWPIAIVGTVWVGALVVLCALRVRIRTVVEDDALVFHRHFDQVRVPRDRIRLITSNDCGGYFVAVAQFPAMIWKPEYRMISLLTKDGQWMHFPSTYATPRVIAGQVRLLTRWLREGSL